MSSCGSSATPKPHRRTATGFSLAAPNIVCAISRIGLRSHASPCSSPPNRNCLEETANNPIITFLPKRTSNRRTPIKESRRTAPQPLRSWISTLKWTSMTSTTRQFLQFPRRTPTISLRGRNRFELAALSLARPVQRADKSPVAGTRRGGRADRRPRQWRNIR